MKMLNQFRFSGRPCRGASTTTGFFANLKQGLIGAIIVLFLWPSGEIQAQVPTLPGWITDTLFIDYSAPTQGDGSFENPMNSFHQQPLWGLPTWSSGSNLLIKSNTAFLFKNGVVHNISPRIRIDGDNNYFGSYGSGYKAVIQIGSGQLNTRGARQTVRDLELRGAVQDTTYLTVNWNFYGSGDYETSQPRTTTLDIDGLDITYGYRAIDIQRFRRVDIKNVYITDVWHDGMFMSAIDSVFVDNFHLENYNKAWEFAADEYHNTGNSSLEPGGDGIQITGGTYSSIKYFELNNSIIDGSRYGGKFNFIAAGNTGTVIIKNSTFLMHPYKLAFHAGANFFVYNSTFIGPGGSGIHYNTKFYNCLFVGTDRNINIIDNGANRAGYAIRGTTRDIYNSVFANWFQAIGGVGANPNIRNTIFYNTTRAMDLGYRKADASGIIHYNPEGNDNLGLQHYQSTDDYEILNPQFVNPNVDFTWINSDNRQNVSGKYPHHYVVWNDIGDWRLQQGSPLIDAGDPNVYNPQATFLANVNSDGNSFTRNYTQYHQITDDIEGTARPQGNGYDIGAYEYTSGSSTSYFSVDFTVKNAQNVPITNATITFNNQTNAPGNYSFGGIPAGTYGYSVSAPNYQPLTVNSFNVNADATVTAILQPTQYQVQLNPNPGQGGTVSGAGNYNFGQNATVSATPAQGYAFVNWTENGSVVSTNATYTFSVSQNRNLTANFSSNSYTISLNSNPASSGTTTGAGNYSYGQNATVSASPAQGFAFNNWTENGNVVSTNATYTFSVSQNRNLTANFSSISYSISLNSSPASGGTTAGAGNYNSGQNATVSASPAQGYAFTNWTEGGNVVSTNASYTFSVSQNRNLTANFSSLSYTISLGSIPASGGSTAGAGNYSYGQNATISATPAQGYAFVNWTEGGNVVSTNASYSFAVSQNRNLVANFSLNSYTISLGSIPASGGSTTGAGIYNYGQNAAVSASPAQGYAFVNWTENGNVVSTNASYTFSVSQNRNLTANFSPNSYGISLTSSPASGGTTTGAGNYNYGQNATVSATPAQGYAFINWTENGNVVSTNATYPFVVSQSRNLTANFSTNSYGINLNSSPSSGGSTIGAGNYNYGQNATVSASPAQGYAFINWTENGTVVSTNATYSFVVSQNRNLTANFSTNSYGINLNSSPSSGGTTTGAGNYNYGQNATVSASAAEGYAFSHWAENGDAVSSNATYSFSVVGDRLLTAHFSRNAFQVTLVSSPAEGGVTSGEGAYLHGNIATVSATPSEGFSFVNWTENGEVVSSNASFSFNVNQTRLLTANFATDVFVLIYLPSDNGSLEGEDIQYVTYGGSGTPVYANPNVGYHFVSWCDSSVGNPRVEVNVDTNITRTAFFDKNIYTLAYSAGSHGTIVGSEEQFVEHGEDGSMVEAVPYAGYKFVKWSDGVTMNPRIDLMVGSDIEVFASFEKEITEVEDINGDGITVYPIPTKRILHVDIQQSEEYEAYLINNSGSLVSNLPNATQGSNSYNVAWLSPGVYYLNLVAPGKHIVKKIIKSR